MKKQSFSIAKTMLFVLFISNALWAQTTTTTPSPSEFWKKVQFGGGVTLNVGNNYSTFGVAPSMLYNVNEYISTGAGLQVSYTSGPNFSAMMYGISATALANPVENIQLSVDLEELKVDRTNKSITPNYKDTIWNTALFLGAGYRTGSITAGVKYNVLHKAGNNIYNEAFLPFVRVYF
jgi:hypothetical protein